MNVGFYFLMVLFGLADWLGRQTPITWYIKCTSNSHSRRRRAILWKWCYLWLYAIVVVVVVVCYLELVIRQIWTQQEITWQLLPTVLPINAHEWKGEFCIWLRLGLKDWRNLSLCHILQLASKHQVLLLDYPHCLKCSESWLSSAKYNAMWWHQSFIKLNTQTSWGSQNVFGHQRVL